jgi:hypothetical protein
VFGRGSFVVYRHRCDKFNVHWRVTMRLASLAILLLLVSSPVSAVTITFTDLDLGSDGQFCGWESVPVCHAVVDGIATVTMSDNFQGDIVNGALEIYGGNAWFDVAWLDAGPHHTFGLDLIADPATLVELYGEDLQAPLFTATGSGSYSVTTALQQYGLLWHVEGPGSIVVDNIRFNPDPVQSVPETPTWLMAMASGMLLLRRRMK